LALRVNPMIHHCLARSPVPVVDSQHRILPLKNGASLSTSDPLASSSCGSQQPKPNRRAALAGLAVHDKRKALMNSISSDL